MPKMSETLLERLPIGLLITDKNGCIQKSSLHLEKMFGYKRGELTGQSVDILLPESKRTQHIAHRNAYANDPTIMAMGKGRVLIAQHKSGSALKVEVMLDHKDDEEAEVLITIIEVSEREVALEALRESQKINKTGTWYFDLLIDEVWWSPELFRIFELPVSPMAPPYETHKSLFTQESWERLEPAVAKATEKGQPYELELELSRPDNVKRFAIARCEPQRDKDGNVVRLVGTFQDITELTAARSERDRILERLTLAKTAAGIGIWEWDLETDELLWDDRMYEMYGLEGPPTTLNDWRNAVHPDDREKAEAALQRAVTSGAVFKSDFRINRQSEVRHILAFAATRNSRMIGVNIDITVEVRLREEARRINNLDSLGALAGGIAHDFNNHLASILASSELLTLRADDTDYVSETAKKLCVAVESAANLTRQLLTFAKGGAPVRQSASIEELVQQNVEFSLHGASLGVNYQFEDNLWNANVDIHQMGQVIQNIVINANQAMTHSGGTLSISAKNLKVYAEHQVLEAGRYIELIIEDDGPGMAETVVSHIFDPYFTTKAAGHGLGLAICHSIITQHNGTISVSSTPGQGTRFYIRLPAANEPAYERQHKLALLKGSGKVLVVDDIPEVLESMGKMVEALGYNCVRASDVKGAVGVFKQALNNGNAFDIVITDLTMPGSGGGLDILLELKMVKPDVKVIIVSGYANNEITSQAESIGFAGKLNKPFTLNELSLEMHRIVQEKQHN